MAITLDSVKNSSSLPGQTDTFLNIQAAPAKSTRLGFAAVSASGFDPLELTTICTGSGMAVSQTGGNALITTGTTANSETIGRSLVTFDGSVRMRYFHTLSQRIANNSFYIELVDVLGDGLAMTINSTTSVTIVVPGTTLTSANVGQSIYIGNLTGTAGTIPGRYAIASVSGTSITFTVAGWPASGSGTASLFGWNYHHVLYDGTVDTTAKYGCARVGYATADISITTTAVASGEMGVVQASEGKASLSNSSGAAGVAFTSRTSTGRNVPIDGTPLYIQLRATNGTTNPATTTTWTVGFVEVENYIPQSSTMDNVSVQSFETALPVSLQSTNTAAQVTVIGAASHSSALSGNAVRTAGRVVTSVDTTLVSNDVCDFFMTSGGAVITKMGGAPEIDWTYAPPVSGISNTTTAVTVKAAAGAGIRNYISGLDLSATALGTATEFAIRDGASGTVIWRTQIPVSGLPLTNVTFDTPLRGTAATLLEIVTLTATTTGSVYCNIRGYTAP